MIASEVDAFSRPCEQSITQRLCERVFTSLFASEDKSGENEVLISMSGTE